jgi:hypothetical protein
MNEFMWQTVLVLLVLLGVSIYLVRHFVRVYRAEDSACGGCAGCCSHGATGKNAPLQDKIEVVKETCQDMKTHDHEACH